MTEPQRCGSIPILEESVTVGRDIPKALTGKVHWIEWSMFCDRLDDALKPLRALALEQQQNVHQHRRQSWKKRKLCFRQRKKTIKSKVLKNLQRVCDKQAQQYAPIIQDFILYCPCGERTASVTNWHIQVVPRAAAAVFPSSSSFDLLDSVPATISVPNTPTSRSSVASATFPPLSTLSSLTEPQQQQQPPTIPMDLSNHSSSNHARRQRCFLHNSNRIHNNNHNNNLQRQASNGSSISTTTTLNPFLDDPNDTAAMSRDGLMELDRQMDWEAWSQVPTIPPDVSQDQMPIPMPPPAPYVKEL